MASEDKKKQESRSGCLILVIFYIGYLVYFFSTTSSKSIEQVGALSLEIAGLAIAYFIIKAIFFNNNDQTGKYGCVKIAIVAIVSLFIIGTIVSALISNELLNYATGIIVVISFVGFFIWFIRNMD